jgi:hypothetical protein
VEAVGSDDEVEPVGGGVIERHGDGVGLLVDRADRVFEHVLRVASGRLIEDGGQFAPHDLDVPPRDPRDHTAHFDVDASTVVTLERDHLGPSAGFHHRGQYAGPLGHVHRGAEQVHGMAAGPYPS